MAAKSALIPAALGLRPAGTLAAVSKDGQMPLATLLFRRRSPDPPTIDIAFAGGVYPVTVTRHRRARRYSLRIHAPTREIVLTIPLRGTLKDAKSFADRHAAWIAARLGRLPTVIPFADGAIVPLRGTPHRIVHRHPSRGTVWTEVDDVRGPLICVAGDARHLPRRVGDFLKREAKGDLDAATRAHAATLGVSVARVAVRDQSSRWGSCSMNGVLSYSWRLILAPPFVLDYLAAHEVAHLVEMNHSPRFWRVLDRVCPDVARAKTWLDVHGAKLHSYGAGAPAAGDAGADDAPAID